MYCLKHSGGHPNKRLRVNQN